MRLRFTLLALILIAGTVSAQTFRGGIRGTVTDATSAAVPGATVTATHVGTGLARTAVTDAAGNYFFSELPLGDWNVTASLTGFSTATVKGVRVEASSVRRVDFALRPGGGPRASTWWRGARSSTPPATRRAARSPANRPRSCPLNGRDFTKLLTLVPGSQSDPSGINDSPGSFGLFSVNGNRGRANNYLLDGTDMNDGYRNLPAINEGGVFGTPATILPVDAVEEFPIISGAEAEYGRNSGRDREHRHEVGHQRAPRQPLRVLPRRRARRAELLQRGAAAEERLPQQPVRRLARRPARQGQDLLLPGLRRAARDGRPADARARADPGELAAAIAANGGGREPRHRGAPGANPWPAPNQAPDAAGNNLVDDHELLEPTSTA